MNTTRRKRLAIKLKPKDLEEVLSVIRKSKEPNRVIRRALILQFMNQGFTAPKAASLIGMTAMSARNVAWRYIQSGLASALKDCPRPGKPSATDQKQKSRIIAMVCSSPPEGYARWTIRLISEESVKRKIVANTNRETIRILLKSHELKPWLKKNVVHG